VIDTTLNSRQLSRHFLVGLAGSAVLIAMLFYAVSTRGGSVDPTRIVDVIRNSSWLLFFLFVLTSIIGIWFRSVRYRILIVAAGEATESTPGHGQMLLITAVRGMVVDLLPARLGELLYIGLLKKVAGTSVSSGLSSLLFAMMLDIAVLAPVTVGLGLLVGFPNTTPYQVAIIALAIVAVFFAGARYILPWFAKAAENLQGSGSRIVAGLANLVLDINRAFQLTLEAGVFVRVIILTIVVRALKYLGLMLLFTSIVSGSFPNMEVVSNVQALTAMIASEMTASLPIPTLMSFGAWELGGTTFLPCLVRHPPTPCWHSLPFTS